MLLDDGQFIVICTICVMEPPPPNKLIDWAGFNVLPRHSIGHFGDSLSTRDAHKHIITEQ